MKTELTSIDKIIIIDEMLVKMGYSTDNITVDDILDIKNVIIKTLVKLKIPKME